MNHEIPWRETPPDIVKMSNIGLPDLLSTMMEQQRQHLINYGHGDYINPQLDDGPAINHHAIQAKIREFWAYSVEEMYEAIGHLKNKPWRETITEVDRGAFMEEVADSFHFLFEMMLFARITPEELFRAYFAKTLINIDRQNGDY